MSRFFVRSEYSIGLCALFICAGCSGKPTITMNESVEGTVTLDGQPVPNVLVQFVPDIDSKYQAPMSSGYTNAKGEFKLACDNKKTGAVIGKHNVVIFSGRPDGGDDESAPKVVRSKITVPPIYSTATQTPLKIEITADKHTYNLPLSSNAR